MNLGAQNVQFGCPMNKPNSTNSIYCSRVSIRCSYSSVSSLPYQSLRCAVLGAGFAGLSVTWHLLQHSPKDMHLHIDMYDEVGIGGGASGVSGGLLHPYSPKVKPLWHAVDCWKRSLDLLTVAEDAHSSKCLSVGRQVQSQDTSSSIVRRRGILRPATSMKNLDLMNDNAQSSLASCRIESICEDAVEKLVPNLRLPLGMGFYMPEAVNIHPQRYLEGLYLACENLKNGGADGVASNRDFCLHKERVDSLQELAREYDTVIICLGARAAFSPELSGKLPLRTCRGVVAHLQLDDDTR
ncbi:dehydrogenase [Lithospermum erythrorhizon]|uniref:Dehydrogenase n=1 Tax=Lithospermum erythrorhizon TaxID=34254 RepID=A0AAV3QBZ8_LITER